MILWPDREADGANETTTPSKIVGTRDEKGRLEKVRSCAPTLTSSCGVLKVLVAREEVRAG